MYKMATDQERNSNEDDITSGVLIDTQYPVEKFHVKWRISNISKIFNMVEAEFSTPSKSTTWKLQFYNYEIMLRNCCSSKIRIKYKAFTETCHQILERNGSYEFNGVESCNLLQIPQLKSDPGENTFHSINDVLNFECTLSILGHTITRNTPLLDVHSFSSKQINCDMENLFHSKEHFDIMISNGENKIPAHKAILCARSPVFNVMFQQDMIENTNNEIEIDDVDIDVLQDFLLFLYSGFCKDISWDNAMKLYYTADKYDVKDLRDICVEYMQANLTTENACTVLKLADQHRDDKLKESVVCFIRMYASSIKMMQSWKDLTRTHPKIITENFF